MPTDWYHKLWVIEFSSDPLAIDFDCRLHDVTERFEQLRGLWVPEGWEEREYPMQWASMDASHWPPITLTFRGWDGRTRPLDETEQLPEDVAELSGNYYEEGHEYDEEIGSGDSMRHGPTDEPFMLEDLFSNIDEALENHEKGH